MILALIGVMTTQHRRRLIGYNTTRDEDVPGPVNIDSYEECRPLKFTSVDLLDTRTTLPFALPCKFNAALLLEKAMHIFECMPELIPLAARVDGIKFAAKAREDINEVMALAQRKRYPISNRFVYAIKEPPRACLSVHNRGLTTRFLHLQSVSCYTLATILLTE